MVNEDSLRKSFQKIKEEMNNLKKNDEYFQNDIDLLKTEIHDQSFIEKIANSIIEKIESRLKTVETIDEKPPETPETQPEIINHKYIPNHVDSTIFLKRKIKTKIINLCEQRVRPGDLKRAIVDMAKLCSKATFYRYISELKKEGIIQVMEINNEAFLISQETILDRNIYK